LSKARCFVGQQLALSALTPIGDHSQGTEKSRAVNETRRMCHSRQWADVARLQNISSYGCGQREVVEGSIGKQRSIHEQLKDASLQVLNRE
jgi:hypothetical protein